MSNKVSFVLSLIFILNILFFATDIISYQIFVSKVDMVSINARSMIQRDAGFTLAEQYVQNELPNGTLVCLEHCSSPSSGQLVKFSISATFTPILTQFLNNQSTTVTVQRAILIS